MARYVAYDVDTKEIVAIGTIEQLCDYANEYGVCSVENYNNMKQGATYVQGEQNDDSTRND